MLRIATAALLAAAVLLGGEVAASPRPACGAPGSYAEALCAFQSGELARAEELFTRIIETEDPSPQVIRSHYFLARTLMRQERFDEASRMFIEIHSLDPAFYREWSCDFLLGEARRRLALRE
jgi:TolA-binding protein